MKPCCKKAAAAGIICEVLYFISVTMFLVTKNDIALTLWELMTVAGAVVMLIGMIVMRRDTVLTRCTAD